MYTAAQVAEMLERSVSWVQRKAMELAERGVNIEKAQVRPKTKPVWVFYTEHVEALREERAAPPAAKRITVNDMCPRQCQRPRPHGLRSLRGVIYVCRECFIMDKTWNK